MFEQDLNPHSSTYCTVSLPDLVYFIVHQIWFTLVYFTVRQICHCPPDLVYFTVYQIWSISLSARSVTVHQIWSTSQSARSGLFHCPPDLVYFTVRQICHCPPDLVYFTVRQIWSISLSARSGLFHCPPDLVYFTVHQIWLSARSGLLHCPPDGLFHCPPDLVYFTVCQIWSISLSARSGLFHCPPDLVHCPSDLVYFTVHQIWSISLSARSDLCHYLPDLVYFPICQISPSDLDLVVYYTTLSSKPSRKKMRVNSKTRKDYFPHTFFCACVKPLHLYISFSYAMVCECWADNPADRPNFSKLVKTFSSFLEGIAGYLDFTPDTQDKDLPLKSGYDRLNPVRNVTTGYDRLNPTVIISDASADGLFECNAPVDNVTDSNDHNTPVDNVTDHNITDCNAIDHNAPVDVTENDSI